VNVSDLVVRANSVEMILESVFEREICIVIEGKVASCGAWCDLVSLTLYSL
jgi:hypothetical protein